jgi:hypothetical protein
LIALHTKNDKPKRLLTRQNKLLVQRVGHGKNEMMKLITSRTLWTAIGLWALFWPMAFGMTRHALFDLLNALSVSVGVGVLIAYLPATYKALTTSHRTGGDLLVLGINCTWFAVIGRQIYLWWWRWHTNIEAINRGEGPLNHVFFAFLVWMLILGGVLHLSARGAIEGIPPVNWVIIGGTVASGLALFLCVLLFLGPL